MSLRDFASALRRRWVLFVGVLAGVVAFVMLLTLALPPVYETQASVRVRPSQDGGLGSALLGGLEGMVPGGLSLPGVGGNDVPTEIGVLGSRRIIESVADSMGLHIALARPWRALRSEVLDILDGGGEEAPRGTFTLSREPDGSYSVAARRTRGPVVLPERVTIGEPFRIGAMELMLLPELRADPPKTVRLRVTPFRRMIDDLQEDLRIEREDAGSRLIEIRYRHTDPFVARGLVNGIVNRFLDYSMTVNKSDSHREVEILTEQVSSYKQRLSDAERRLQDYQEAERIVAPEEQATQQIRRVAELQVVNDALRVERQALVQFLAQVTAREPRPSMETPYRQLASFPSFITNEAVQTLLEVLTTLETERAELLVRRTEVNRDVRVLQERIREIEEQLFALATDYVEGLDTQITATGEALAEFAADLEAIPAVELEYARRQRDRRLLSEIYLVLEARVAQARVQEAIDDAQVRIVDLGVIPDRPAFPRPEISLALSSILGLMLGLFAVVVAETTSPGVRTPREAELIVGAPVLATIPSFRGAPGRGSARQGPIILTDRWHPAAEAFRSLALALTGGSALPGALVVTSPAVGEGRTTVAANLAVALAEQGLRVGLLDADLRNQGLHHLLGTASAPGWAEEALEGRTPGLVPQAVDVGQARGSVDFFPAGSFSGHPLEALNSEEAQEFLTHTRGQYDVLLIDTPSLAVGPDAVLLAGRMGAALIVAASGKTEHDALAAAAEQLRRAGSEVLGAVLNQKEGR